MFTVKKAFVTKLNNPSSKLLGFANVSLSFGESETWDLTINGCKIFDSKKGFMVALPQRKDEKGAKDDNGYDKYWDVLSINKDSEYARLLMEEITRGVKAEYDKQGNPGNREKNAAKKPAPNSRPSSERTFAQGDPDVIDDEDVPFQRMTMYSKIGVRNEYQNSVKRIQICLYEM